MRYFLYSKFLLKDSHVFTIMWMKMSNIGVLVRFWQLAPLLVKFPDKKCYLTTPVLRCTLLVLVQPNIKQLTDTSQTKQEITKVYRLTSHGRAYSNHTPWNSHCITDISVLILRITLQPIIITYLVEQQWNALEILSLRSCCLSGILSRRIFQIQELSGQSCYHSTCQIPDFFHS